MVDDFPHLVQIWGHVKFSSFTQLRATRAFEAYSIELENGMDQIFSETHAREVLLKGLHYSPFLLVQDTLEKEYPVFSAILAAQTLELKKAIITEITVFIFPGGDLICNFESLVGNDQLIVPVAIGKYLNRYVAMATAK